MKRIASEATYEAVIKTLQYQNDAPSSPELFVEEGEFGTLTMYENGTWDYEANENMQAVAKWQQARDVFTYMISDGEGGFDTAKLVISVYGRNDAPEIDDGPDAEFIDETNDPLSETGTLTVRDGDTRDRVHVEH